MHKWNLFAVSLSFRLVRNLSDGSQEGFPTRFTRGNDKYIEFIHRLYLVLPLIAHALRISLLSFLLPLPICQPKDHLPEPE